VATEIKMPQLGESVVEGTITRWLKKEGDSVAEDELLVEVSTDKVDSEVPSSAAGTIQKILVQEGETVKVGTAIAVVGEGAAEPSGDGAAQENGDGRAEEAPEEGEQGPEQATAEEEPDEHPEAAAPQEEGGAEPEEEEAEPAREQARAEGDADTSKRKIISPLVRRLAQEHGIDLEDVQGTTFGGGNAINATNFGDAGQPLFTDPPGCVFLHQASFITGFAPFSELEAGTDYDFFGFPDINPEFAGALEGAGDLFGMFHDTPAARSLMRYLVTAEAQSIWTAIGGAISANTTVTEYPDDIAARSGELLAESEIFVFDASDLMPTAMNQAFWTAMVDLAAGADLDATLETLDTVQAEAYAEQ
jgi:multidrug efflux pump subunit AcrA (membrane-fusion protein)